MDQGAEFGNVERRCAVVDYFKVEPDYTRLMNKHYTRGRGGSRIEFITRHHNGGVSSTDGSWDTWQSREASAHYQIETTGRVGQLVNDGDTAWANGNASANARTIAIEHSNNGGADYAMNDATVVAGAKWAAALCWFYKLGRPQYGKNIRDHRDFYSTACPYHLANGGKYHARYMQVAQAHYDSMVGAKLAPVINEIDSEANRAKVWLGKRITKGENVTPDGKGRFAQFENGYVYFHPDVRLNQPSGDRAIAVPTHVFETWAVLGWETGPLGYPLARHAVIEGVGDIQGFQGGVIYRKYGEPGYFVTGRIWDRFAATGYENGNGWPTTNERDFDGGRMQRFENLDMLYHPSTVSRLAHGKVSGEW